MNASTENGMEVIIAAAGGAAHLAGVTAAITSVPVLAVPMKAWSTEGLDSLLSMVQMPGGVPVGTLAVGKPGAKNAALLATAILGNKYPEYKKAYENFRTQQTADGEANQICRRSNIFCVGQIFYWRLRCGRARKGPFQRVVLNLYIPLR